MAILFKQKLGLFKSFNQKYDFRFLKIEEIENKIIGEYILDKYESVWLNNHRDYEAFPNRFSVISGGWYGDKGRWRAKKRKKGKISIYGVYDKKQEPSKSHDFFFEVKKPFLSSVFKFIIQSEQVGKIIGKAVEIEDKPNEKIILFDSQTDKPIDVTNSLMDNGFTWIGNI